MLIYENILPWTDRQNDNSNTIRDRGHLHSLSGKGAGAWVSAIPSSSHVALSVHDFHLATMMRL